jgi:hypothetical protein
MPWSLDYTFWVVLRKVTGTDIAEKKENETVFCSR